MNISQQKKIRLLLVDDEVFIRQGLSALLELEPDFEIVWQASNGAEAVQCVHDLAPDVVLMDLQMPVMDGVAAIATIVESGSAAKLIALTTFDDSELVIRAMQAGACAYLLKDCGSKQLAAAIRSSLQGFTTFSGAVSESLINEARRQASAETTEAFRLFEQLSPREQEVLKLLSSGRNNKAIAEACCVTEKTVRDHVSNILGTLGLRDRTQAALWAADFFSDTSNGGV